MGKNRLSFYVWEKTEKMLDEYGILDGRSKTVSDAWQGRMSELINKALQDKLHRMMDRTQHEELLIRELRDLEQEHRDIKEVKQKKADELRRLRQDREEAEQRERVSEMIQDGV